MVEVRHEFALSDGSASFTVAGSSDRGAVRRLNEDSFLARLPVFVVADGMGGHAFGDRASQAAVAVFAEHFGDMDLARPQDVLDTVDRANDAVLRVSSESDTPGALSGTTLAGVALVELEPAGLGWMVFNVGDSRVYSWDGRALRQVSKDHSAVQEMVDAGEITKEQSERHPDRNIVTRALGASHRVLVDSWIMPAVGHQAFVVCSDGLTKELDDDEIAGLIAQNTGGPVALIAERLVTAAVAAGGSDNVTVVMVEADFATAPDEDMAERPRTVDPAATLEMLEDTLPKR
ncbi:MAG: protein phosphatase 2C domain-containing protein [Actinomycetota bacterium]